MHFGSSAHRLPNGGRPEMCYAVDMCWLRTWNVPAVPCIIFAGGGVEDAELLHIKVDCEKPFVGKNREKEELPAALSLTGSSFSMTTIFSSLFLCARASFPCAHIKCTYSWGYKVFKETDQ